MYLSKTKVLIAFFYVFSSCSIITAQSLQEYATAEQGIISEARKCGTPSKNVTQRRHTLEVVDPQASDRSSSATGIPVRIHIVTRDDGSEGISTGDINIGISYLNSFYKDAGIEFYICSENIINSTAWWDFDDTEEDAMVAAHSVDDAVNIYFVDEILVSGNGACGYAYYPANADYSLNILMDNDCTVTYPNGTLVHELGHFFDLAHTHDGTEDGNMDSNAEHVPRTGANSNCATDGDQLCDTPADPRGDNDTDCNYINDGTDPQDIFANTYAPDLDNVMSYYSDYCGGGFTAGQYGRISAALTVRLAHTAYNLDGCAPTVVTDPSGLTAVLNNEYSIDLSWTDNASNELGYLVERSTDAGTTWFPLIGGGVGPDITSYKDESIEANTNYEYRIKASNDNCSDYSNVASVSVGLIHCLPTHQANSCVLGGGGTLGVGIYSLQLKDGATNLIDNPNNGCNGAISVFSSTHSAAVVAGQSYDVEANLQLGGSGSYYSQYMTVWVDVNQNGSFDDVGEMLYQAATADGPDLSGAIAIPATILEGITTMRIRTGWGSGGQVDDPCGYWALSETEDYELSVTNPLPVAITNFNAKLVEDQIILDWITETEVNNDYFIIEKSIDGRNFEMLGKVNGGGTNLTRHSYQLIDSNPSNGTNYYRLVQFDFDGSFEMLDRVISKEYNAGQQVISVQPNPVQGEHIQLVYQSEQTGNLDVQIFDINGKRLMNFDFQAMKSRNIFDITLNDLSKGVYVIKTNQGGHTQSIRFVKSN